MAKSETKYFGVVASAIGNAGEFLLELENLENGTKKSIRTHQKELEEVGLSLNEPYFELSEIVHYYLVPKEFGGMETVVERSRKFKKLNLKEPQ